MRKSQRIDKFRKGYDDDKPLRKGQVRRVRRNAREVIREQLVDMAAEQEELMQHLTFIFGEYNFDDDWGF